MKQIKLFQDICWLMQFMEYRIYRLTLPYPIMVAYLRRYMDSHPPHLKKRKNKVFKYQNIKSYQKEYTYLL